MPQTDILETGLLAPEITSIIDSAPTPGLSDGPSCSTTKQAIQSAMTDSPLQDTLSEAALWLLSGDLDRSHSISQNVDSVDGSFWHGIMHRREGEFGNAKYWFRRVGSHPVHTELAARIASSDIDWSTDDFPLASLAEPLDLPFTLIDLTESALGEHPQWQADIQQICWWEWQLMFARG